MKPIVLLFALLFLLLLSGCAHEPHTSLSKADAVMEGAPDSALSILESLDITEFTPADSNYFALLLTQAQVKTGLYINNDSLIARARQAYRYTNDLDKRLRSAFYFAQVAFDGGHYPTAARAAFEAYGLADGNHYWRAKSAELIADIFAEAYNYDQEEIYRRETVQEYLLAGRIRNHRFALCDLACNYINQSYYAEACHLVDSLLSVTNNAENDSILSDYISEVRIAALNELGEYDEATKLLSDSTTLNNNTPFENLIQLSFAEMYTQKSDSIDNILLLAARKANGATDSIRVAYASYRNAMVNQDYKQAALLSDSLLKAQSAIARDLLKESAMSIQSEYYAERASEKAKHIKLLQVSILALLICFVITFTSVVVYKNLRIKLKTAEVEQGLAEIRLMKIQSDSDTQLIETLYKGKWQTLNMLSKEYFELSSSKEMHKFLIQNIEKEINALSSNENLTEIERATNKYLGGIITRLRSSYPLLKDSDVKFATLIFAGLSVRTICVLLKIHKDTFYQKKNRLIKKIQASESPYAQEFISRLNSFEK